MGICDVDGFLFGNLVPDIYAGHMVPDASRKIDYRETHLVDPLFVPEPDYGAFFERFAAPSADESGRVSDLVLGTWAHLVADHTYNRRFNELLEQRGLKACDDIRKQKQADFDLYGRTLDISWVPEPTDALKAGCAQLPQFPIEASDVEKTCEVVRGIVANNREHHVSEPTYELLGSDYFRTVSDEVDTRIRAGLHAYAAGDGQWGARL